MTPSLRAAVAASAIAVVALVSSASAAKVEVQSDRDKQFDFSKVKTWAGDPKEPGKVIMARPARGQPRRGPAALGTVVHRRDGHRFPPAGPDGGGPHPGRHPRLLLSGRARGVRHADDGPFPAAAPRVERGAVHAANDV